MKTRHPLILTACIENHDLEPFEDLRRKHFPPERNFLKAHITMFHRLPGEYRDRVIGELRALCGTTDSFSAVVGGVLHLGGGVAFTIDSPQLQAIRAQLKTLFMPWLGPQDMRPWQPHITIQNKVSKTVSDALYRELSGSFRPTPIGVVGLDLWRYLGGPWQEEACLPLQGWPEGQMDAAIDAEK